MKKIVRYYDTKILGVERKYRESQLGFTFPELIIILSILAVVFGFITINLVNSQHRSSLTGTVDTLISDMKSQQLKAMVGATEGRTSADSYGIYFQTNNYTLFHGTTYSSSDPANFVITLDPLVQFASFPATVVFSQRSGETGMVNTITIQDIGNSTNQKTIMVNRYGVITQVN